MRNCFVSVRSKFSIRRRESWQVYRHNDRDERSSSGDKQDQLHFTLEPFFFGFQAMSLLYPKTIDMFHFGGDKQTNPNCPIELRPSLNPSSGIQSYDDSDPVCLKPAYYNFPFFLNKLGPRSSEWSINAHEARPGHHIQVMIFVVCRKLSRTHKTDWFSRFFI